MAWSFAFTAQPGPGKPVCQDSVLVQEDGDGIVLAVSDGAGSAKFGDAAAELATRSAAELHEKLWADDWKGVLSEIQCRLKQLANGRPLEEFASTLVLASIRPEGLRLLQVGDGGGVARSPEGDLQWIGTEPSEYMNVTTFLHESKAEDRAIYLAYDQPPAAICLFSDGLQHLVVDPLTGTVHTPFFERVWNAPRQPGLDERASAWLAQMAQSEPVRKRTNDDISIAVARRLDA